MSTYFGSEFYEERHGETLAGLCIDPNPRCKNMSVYEVEGRLARLWSASQKLKQVVLSRHELLVYSGMEMRETYHKAFKMECQSSWVTALTLRGLIRPVEGDPEKFEIAGNAKRIEAIELRSKAGKKANEIRWNDPNRIRTGIRSESNDNDNDNDNELERDTPVSQPVSTKQAPVDYEGFISAWNENRGQLPECKKLGESRKKKIKMRLAEEPDLAYWVGAIKNLAGSKFAVENNWCDINWLIENDNNHRKASSGKYNEQKKQEVKLDFNYICGGKGRL